MNHVSIMTSIIIEGETSKYICRTVKKLQVDKK